MDDDPALREFVCEVEMLIIPCTYSVFSYIIFCFRENDEEHHPYTCTRDASLVWLFIAELDVGYISIISISA